MPSSPTISSKEEYEKAKSELAEEINSHKAKTSLFREQIKMFVRQGVEELPQKQQETYEAIEAKEKELQKRLSELELAGKQFK